MQGNAQLANGINTAGAALAGAIDKHREEQKRIADQGKVADGLVAQYPDLLKPLNLTPEQFKNMGAKDKAPLLEGAVKGIQLLQQATQQRQQQTLLDQRIREQQQQQADDASMNQYFQQNQMQPEPADMQQLTGDVVTNSLTGQNPNVWRTPTPQLLEGYVRQNPAAALRNAHNLSYLDKALAQGGEAITPSFIQDPRTGARFVTRGNTMLPSGNDPELALNNLPKVPGMIALPTGKGNFIWKIDPNSGLNIADQIKLLELQQKSSERDFSDGYQERQAALRDEIQKLKQSGSTAKVPPVNHKDPLGLFE